MLEALRHSELLPFLWEKAINLCCKALKRIILSNIHVILAWLQVQNSEGFPNDTHLLLTFVIPTTHFVQLSQGGFITFTWRSNHKWLKVLKNFLQDYFFHYYLCTWFEIQSNSLPVLEKNPDILQRRWSMNLQKSSLYLSLTQFFKLSQATAYFAFVLLSVFLTGDNIIWISIKTKLNFCSPNTKCHTTFKAFWRTVTDVLRWKWDLSTLPLNLILFRPTKICPWGI